MQLRPEREADLLRVRALHEAAFGRDVEARLTDELRADGDAVVSLVVDEDDVVGHVLLSRARIGARASLALGPVGVRPDRQRRGIGRVLISGALDAAEQLNAPEVVLLGDPALYGRLGFVAAEALGVLSPDPAWGRYFQVRPLTAWDPDDVGRFSYAPAFQRL